MAIVTATLTVDFSSGKASTTTDQPNALLSLLLDNRAVADGGLNQGRSRFYFGDDVYFLLFKSTRVRVSNVDSSAGSFVQAGSGSYDFQQFLTYSNATSASIQYPASLIKSASWIGRNRGNWALEDQTLLEIPKAAVGVLDVKYRADYTVYRLHGVVTGETPVVVFVEGTY